MKIRLKYNGFTIVEIMVVIVILGILVSLTAFGFRGWQQGITQRQAQSDLRIATSAIESAKNFSTGYPLALPSTYKPSSGITLTYVGGNATTYCIEARGTQLTSIVYRVDSAVGKDPVVGACGSAYQLNTPAPSIGTITSDSMVVSWASITGATSYEVKYGPVTPSSTAACSSSPCTLSGLTHSTNYKVTVTANSQFNTKTSPIVNATTATPPPPPSAPSVTYTAGSPMSNPRPYTVTASGGTCSQGTVSWKFVANIYQSQQGDPPDWDTASWQASNTRIFNQTTNGFDGPIAPTVFAKPRCTTAAGSTEYSSYAQYP